MARGRQAIRLARHAPRCGGDSTPMHRVAEELCAPRPENDTTNAERDRAMNDSPDNDTAPEGPSHAGRPAPLPAGTRVADRYVIENVVGAGGMGVVYRALEDEIERPVALKFIMVDPNLPPAERDAYNERFLNEAQALGKLPPHPNRVVLYQYGYDSGSELNFMAMELVHGVQLSNIMFERQFSRDTVISYTRQIALALEDVHASGLIHRDLKPENLIVTRSLLGDEQLKLIDFGIAKAPQRVPEDEDEEDRELLGTILYMAPELLMDGVEDPRTDIYAIGVILYELVTGHGPFDYLIEDREEGDEPDITEMVRHHVQSPPGKIQPRAGIGELPQAFEDIIIRCLEKKPDDRFANASELLKALDAMGERRTRHTAMIHQQELMRVDDGEPHADIHIVPGEEEGPPVVATAVCAATALVAASDEGGVTRIWNYRDGCEVLTIAAGEQGDEPIRLGFAPGCGLVALGNRAGELWLCDTELGTRERIPLSAGVS